MVEWTIRRAEPADAAALAACIDAANATYIAGGMDLPAVSEGIADEIRDDIVWVAVSGGAIVGGMVLVLHQEPARLANVAVHPAATGAGIGRALIDQAEREARCRGVRRLALTTHVAMPQNVRLYRSLGWRETGRDGNMVLMEKPIAG